MNLIRIKAFPDAKRDHVEETAPHVLRVFVREAPQHNMANRAVIRAVAKFYQIPEKRLRMISGHQKQSKILQVLGSDGK